MKPITYWLQNEAIDQLVVLYGDHLQRMTPDSRRNLLVYLAEDARIHNWPAVDYEEADQAWRLVEALTRREKDFLIEAIAATLTHTHNPWVEAAREMVAIEQAHKKGLTNFAQLVSPFFLRTGSEAPLS